uniref:Uncharacterized protein n=1 Tax=Panagrolaimus sp. ES5 TaxID=591445 RepID=A0AC34GNU9_9BILA
MDNRTWNLIVERLSRRALKKLDKEEFDDFLLQAHISGKAEVLTRVLTSKKKKNRYIRLLDTCYKNAKAENCIPLEEKFLQKVPLEDLPDLIEAEALKYGVNISISSFPSYRAKLMNDLKLLFQRGDLAAFEQSSIELLQRPNGMFAYKVEFINLLVDNPKYACCWAKFINLKRRVPKFVRKVRKEYQKDAEAFIRRMNGDPSSDNDAYEIENYTVFGKQYEVVIVSNNSALQEFVQEYLIDSTPDILGIDIESNPIDNKIALIQLATKDWCCIIDGISENPISDFNFN